MISKKLIAQFITIISIILLVFSSYIQLYQKKPRNNDDFDENLHFILGNLINSYVINISIIIAYCRIYKRLKAYYDQQIKLFKDVII